MPASALMTFPEGFWNFIAAGDSMPGLMTSLPMEDQEADWKQRLASMSSNLCKVDMEVELTEEFMQGVSLSRSAVGEYHHGRHNLQQTYCTLIFLTQSMKAEAHMYVQCNTIWNWKDLLHTMHWFMTFSTPPALQESILPGTTAV